MSDIKNPLSVSLRLRTQQMPDCAKRFETHTRLHVNDAHNLAGMSASAMAAVVCREIRNG
jgi:hypothetical protein